MPNNGSWTRHSCSQTAHLLDLSTLSVACPGWGQVKIMAVLTSYVLSALDCNTFARPNEHFQPRTNWRIGCWHLQPQPKGGSIPLPPHPAPGRLQAFSTNGWNAGSSGGSHPPTCSYWQPACPFPYHVQGSPALSKLALIVAELVLGDCQKGRFGRSGFGLAHMGGCYWMTFDAGSQRPATSLNDSLLFVWESISEHCHWSRGQRLPRHWSGTHVQNRQVPLFRQLHGVCKT